MNINEKPAQTIKNLLQAFPVSPTLLSTGIVRSVPIGIEIEVPWRAYFPDLWVPGFPRVEHAELARITAECTKREQVLLPLLNKTVECGVNKGCDRYWEFAFEPVTDVAITCNQAEILRANGLLPPGDHSLHITFGGMRVGRNMGYVALALEALACSSKRIESGYGDKYVGWARKGRAGLFQKEGDHDVQHGYGHAAEVRLLIAPDNINDMFALLNLAQTSAEMITMRCPAWTSFVNDASMMLSGYGLPDANWETPRTNANVWQRYAENLPSIQRHVKALLVKHNLI